MKETLIRKRIESIDILRGFVMVLMALDHVRDYFHLATDNPLNLETTTTVLFFTRWITHFCAPTFIFLTGASIYLQSLRKTQGQLSLFLIQRGLWLIFVEVAIVSVGWTFSLTYAAIPLQVIWAIGISMTLMGILVRLPFNAILGLGLAIVLGHNLLDYPESGADFTGGFWWDLLHHGLFTGYSIGGDHQFIIVYPFLPWLGLMMMGYCFGRYYAPSYSPENRRKIFTLLGLGLIGLFILVRMVNQYGDPHPWAVQKSVWFTVLSFINVHKYPPSLMYMCITIGPALMFLFLVEPVKNAVSDFFRTFGRVAFFYYILHIFLIHSLQVVSFFAHGHTWEEGTHHTGDGPPFNFVFPGEGYSLFGVYMVWLVVVFTLYPLSKWYDGYKTRHKEKWWLSYL